MRPSVPTSSLLWASSAPAMPAWSTLTLPMIEAASAPAGYSRTPRCSRCTPVILSFCTAATVASSRTSETRTYLRGRLVSTASTAAAGVAGRGASEAASRPAARRGRRSPAQRGPGGVLGQGVDDLAPHLVRGQAEGLREPRDRLVRWLGKLGGVHEDAVAESGRGHGPEATVH